MLARLDHLLLASGGNGKPPRPTLRRRDQRPLLPEARLPPHPRTLRRPRRQRRRGLLGKREEHGGEVLKYLETSRIVGSSYITDVPFCGAPIMTITVESIYEDGVLKPGQRDLVGPGEPATPAATNPARAKLVRGFAR